MKTQKFKRTLSLFLAMLMCVTTLFGMGTTAFAAEETDEVYLISYPRDGRIGSACFECPVPDRNSAYLPK